MSLLSKLFGRATDQQTAPARAEEDWVLAERPSDSGISLIRVRRLPTGFAFGSSKFRVSITWTYEDGPQAGGPDAAEMGRMERFEQLIHKHIESPNAALLAIVFTQPDFRQYEFYTAEVKRFLHLLNEIPAQSDAFPIEIRQEEDAAGAFYQAYAQGLVSAHCQLGRGRFHEHCPALFQHTTAASQMSASTSIAPHADFDFMMGDGRAAIKGASFHAHTSQ